MICNPSSPEIDTVNYDYDSEAEWEDLADGEDLNSDDEEDAESDDADDMEDFLDDEEDSLKRSCITSDLVVNSSGLCWEDAKGRGREDMKQYKMGFLLVPASYRPFLYRLLACASR
jgi:chromatin assembly factor 1 subunit A